MSQSSFAGNPSPSYAPSAPSLPPNPPGGGYGGYNQNPPLYNQHGYGYPPPSPSWSGNPSGGAYGGDNQNPPQYHQNGYGYPPSSPSWSGYAPGGEYGGYNQNPPQNQQHGYGYPPPSPSWSGYSAGGVGGGGGYFPPGTNPEIIRWFQAVDKDRSGFIDEKELQAALSYGYREFSLRTVRLLMFLFKNPNSPPSKIGPTEFAALWICLSEWQAIFQRFDRDRSGKIDASEFRDALISLGYGLPTSVTQLLLSHYDRDGQNGGLNLDDFIECGLIVKGLTEKFKERDPRYTGSVTLRYDSFMQMVVPFIAA